jgi:tetratricopeptide (TPR) repeat protein
MPSRTTAEDLELALALQERVAEAPQEVVATGRALLRRQRLGAEARAVGHRALARALRVLDRPQDSVREARQSAAVARRAGLTEREAEARLTLALSLFQSGRARVALEQIELASSLATGQTAVLVSAQHGILLARLGRLDEAIARYDEALGGSLAPVDEARVRNNRGIAFAFTGRVEESLADLEAARALARGAGTPMLEGEIVHNLGFAHTVAGDIPAALRRFDEADAMLAAVGVPIGLNLVARTRALLRANLYGEARDAAQAAVRDLHGGGSAADAAEARVLLAIAELEDGDPAQGIATATLARRTLQRQGRPALAALADHVIVRARVALGRRDRRTLGLAERCSDALSAVGLVAEAHEALLTAGILARELGLTEQAAAHLDAVRAHRARGSLVDRCRSWYAEALRRLDDGAVLGARHAVEAGLDLVGELQSLMGAAELQVRAAAHGAALADLGLHMALADNDAWSVLRITDRCRSVSLDLGRVANDPTQAVDLAALRAAEAHLQAVVGEGEDPQAAHETVVELEARIRARARHHRGGERLSRELLDATALRAQLSGATLIVYFEIDGRLGTVVVDELTSDLHPDLQLDRRRSDELIGAALFALRRLVRSNVSASARSAAEASFVDAMGQLDAALVAPFVVEGTAPLVVCPTGPLHALPWSGLPSCGSRPVAVVPALRQLATPVPARQRGQVVLAAGPDLEGALAELDALAGVYPQALTFSASASLVDDVLAGLEGAELAHLACHGRLRVDNPMFSSLALADGALTVFDLDTLEMSPSVVVLAACDVGTAAVSAGDELLGLTAALHRAGTRAVMASLVPVPDHAVVALMLDLHRGLAAGQLPADALAHARRGVPDDSPLAVPLRAAFTCFGR